jgi:hypothetical protein
LQDIYSVVKCGQGTGQLRIGGHDFGQGHIKSDPSVKHFGEQHTITNDEPVPPKPYWQDWSSTDFYDPLIDYHEQRTKYEQELREYNHKLET